MTKRKVFIVGFRIFAILFLFFSFLGLIAIRLSDKDDIVDRNSGWILGAFLLSVGVFIFSVFVSFSFFGRPYRNQSYEELINEIRKSNLDRLKDRQNATIRDRNKIDKS